MLDDLLMNVNYEACPRRCLSGGFHIPKWSPSSPSVRICHSISVVIPKKLIFVEIASDWLICTQTSVISKLGMTKYPSYPSLLYSKNQMPLKHFN